MGSSVSPTGQLPPTLPSSPRSNTFLTLPPPIALLPTDSTVLVNHADQLLAVVSSQLNVLLHRHSSLPALTAGFAAGMVVLALIAFTIWFQRRMGLGEGVPMPAGPQQVQAKAEDVLDTLPIFTISISQAGTATPPPPTPAISDTDDTTLSLPSPMNLEDRSALVACIPSNNATLPTESDAKAYQLIHLAPLQFHNVPPVRHVCYDHQPCSDHVVHVIAPVNGMEKAFQEWKRLESARWKLRDRVIVVIGTSASVAVSGTEVVSSCFDDNERVVVGERSKKMDGKVRKGHVKKDSGVDVDGISDVKGKLQ